MTMKRLPLLLALLASLLFCSLPSTAQTHPIHHHRIHATSTVRARANNDNVVVYTTRTGKCYHRGSCSSLRKSKYRTTVKRAREAGYRPCQNCNPPE